MAVSSGAFLLAWVLWGDEQRERDAASPALANKGAVPDSLDAR